MATVTKKDLIERIAAASGCGRVEAKTIVQCFLDQVIEELARGNRLEFRDFGVLETRDRAARVAQNPKTLERVNVPPKRTVKFKVGRLLKDKLDRYAIDGPPPRESGSSSKAAGPTKSAKAKVVVKVRAPEKFSPRGEDAGSRA